MKDKNELMLACFVSVIVFSNTLLLIVLAYTINKNYL